MRGGGAPASPDAPMPDTLALEPSRARPSPKAGILDIAPYVAGKAQAPGHAHPLKLSANENVLGCSPAASAAYAAAAGRLNLYPEGRSDRLRAAVAEAFALEPERLIFGCGSDEIFSLLCQTFLEPGDNAVQTAFGFFAYRIAVRAAQAEVRFAEQPGRRIDVDALLACVDARTRIVFLDNPGNPTGAWIGAAEVARLHRGLPPDCLLVLDGAYAEFVEDADWTDGLELARGAENIVCTRTFSKIHGLAGLRAGWAYGPEPVVDAMDRIRGAFNVNLPAQEALGAALADHAFVARSQALVREERPRLDAALRALGNGGLETFPSQGNFVLVRFPEAPGRTAGEAEAFLAGRGVLVRGLANYGMGDSLRITIGLPEHNAAVVEGLRAFLEE